MIARLLRTLAVYRTRREIERGCARQRLIREVRAEAAHRGHRKRRRRA